MRAILLALLLTLPGLAAAECTAPGSTVSLGTTNSLSLITTAPQAAGSGGILCTGSLTLLANNFMRVTLNSAAVLSRDGRQIPLQVFTNSGYTNALQPGQPVTLNGATLLNLGGSGATVPLYFRTATGANVPAGTYTATLSLTWQYAVCTGLSALGICTNWSRSPGVPLPTCVVLVCNPPASWGTGSPVTVTVSLVVTKACVISNSELVMDFGTQALVSQFAPVTRNISVTCTNTEGYTVGFDNGQNYQAPWRRMASGSNRLNYNLYFPNTTTVWTTSQTQPMVGNGLQQSVPFLGIIDPNQANVPVGTYTDNVTVIIMY
ncbi:spore coat protein U domain-containing protein [Pseudomonas sp. MM211]|uniref:Csu type fimbrial protein n=1 Tax=Pseudomonas sp. MM211 TaxID=2866808 RepID=UPI001CEC3E83|nr:spore coat protein U domain-containing protein [Pseudomonas sp. MM211]UCJ18531.1 spore coat protein U domain-containing protein [Pseudomonas sp. MM211]